MKETEKGVWDKDRWVFTPAKEAHLQRCSNRITQRDSLIKRFVNGESEFVVCYSCKSSLARDHAQKWHTFHRAMCLVCRKSLLSKDDQAALARLWEEGQADHDAYRKDHPKVPGETEFCPVLPLEGSPSWDQVRPKKKKKWWKLWG